MVMDDEYLSKRYPMWKNYLSKIPSCSKGLGFKEFYYLKDDIISPDFDILLGKSSVYNRLTRKYGDKVASMKNLIHSPLLEEFEQNVKYSNLGIEFREFNNGCIRIYICDVRFENIPKSFTNTEPDPIMYAYLQHCMNIDIKKQVDMGIVPFSIPKTHHFTGFFDCLRYWKFYATNFCQVKPMSMHLYEQCINNGFIDKPSGESLNDFMQDQIVIKTCEVCNNTNKKVKYYLFDSPAGEKFACEECFTDYIENGNI